jgi:tetraacyldisaccharide 4'-kinase
VAQPFLRLASHLFGAVAVARRRWYAAHETARRRLDRPVVSIGNLSVGGSGKTPLTAAVARLLLEAGERPAILSRGYKRRRTADGVVVVSDGASLRADVAHAGDEPFMLARAVPAAAVLVCPDRYLAGRLAERQLGCTVHLLDDGYQHLGLARDVDLLVVTRDDLDDPYPLPLGRLREPPGAAARAGAVLVSSAESLEPDEVARRLGVPRGFGFARALGAPHAPDGGPAPSSPGPVFAMAGIARPRRFFDDLRQAGWTLAGTRAFGDHHRFTVRDLAEVGRAAQAAGAQAILTTEKDMVRLSPTPDPPPPVPVFWVPLRLTLDPAFAPWLRARLAAAVAGPRAH